MRQFIILFIYLSIIYSCKSQDIITDSKKKDVIIFKFKNDATKFVEDFDNTKIYDTDIIITQQKRLPYGSNYFDKYYKFIQEKDTMSIMCNCGQNKNYYFRDLEFKKGNYELRFDYVKKYNQESKKYAKQINYVLGKVIKTSKEVQKILFKNADYDILRKPEYKDLYFKDLKFIEIDLKDSINVKLKRLD